MPTFCLVLNCANDNLKSKDLSFCRVPKVIRNQGKEMEILTSERRRKWLSAISRQDLTDKILRNDRVCGEHFHSGKAAPSWDKFNVDWVPSLNMGHQKYTTDEASLHRFRTSGSNSTPPKKNCFSFPCTGRFFLYEAAMQRKTIQRFSKCKQSSLWRFSLDLQE